MQYASTSSVKGIETIVVILPIEFVSNFDTDTWEPNQYLVGDEVQRGWIKDGEVFVPPPPPPPPTAEEITAEYTAAIQKRLDIFARERGYDNIQSACSYATCSVPHFKLEGEYCVMVRGETWAKCYEVMGAVMAGGMEMPSLEKLFEILPKLEWP
ncbi:MAG: hypothetical protein LBH03_04825 [Holophagales bacterium]|jgi:hypothetical protein|nr:hypothetical protein [Holophagales bacterium]